LSSAHSFFVPDILHIRHNLPIIKTAYTGKLHHQYGVWRHNTKNVNVLKMKFIHHLGNHSRLYRRM